MKLAITGGGTGGHIFPALEVGRFAAESRGVELTYLGSHRGMERAACESRGIPFVAVNGQPLWSLKSVAGWRSLVALLRASGEATRHLRQNPPDRLFSTGGYSAAAWLFAARRNRVPYVVHEANSVPGRTTRMFARGALGYTYVFRATTPLAPANAVRTGQPIRPELRAAASAVGLASGNHVLVMGGSQGAVRVNQAVVAAAADDSNLRFTIAAGRQHADALRADAPANVDVRDFIDAPELADLYRSSRLFIGRSGGTLAEVAAFRLPSVLIPLPSSADDHQGVNAREFAGFGAAIEVPQRSLEVGGLARGIRRALDLDPALVAASLADWDMPRATSAILGIIEGTSDANPR
ncbi:MAG: UDP-N-acetylglucosamine--N-acetylmuramyl-(pentapeptide) pyrophosphoryl-undecaprenol N-acetylglucosamine transferase [Fimbriimonadaceae bacterium]|nr:UDP-N-acetylglucosamine--N-acetylmuramyl-(pentapeptide) pyrophosphoryl-undecaprenol N-acetylglucosamine transferase [Fimbriimonadaceae bacterium]